MEKSMGVSKEMDPPHIVPIQLKNFTPGGYGDQEGQAGEERQVDRAGGEHVVGPHPDRQAAMASVATTRPT